MEDSIGQQLAEVLYGHLLQCSGDYLNPDIIAFALDEATQKLSDSEPTIPASSWAPFVHIGL